MYRDVLDLPDEAVLSADQPLGLRDAMRLANRESERLAAQGEGYLRSVIDRRRTLANFLPTADLAPTLSIRNGGNAGAIGRTGNQIGEFETNADVPVDASLNLFNGFRDVNAYWSDTYRIAQQRSNLLAFQEGLLLDVARSYYQVLRSEATVRVFEGSLRTQEERLREAKGRVAAGLASPLTQAQIAAQLSATRSQLIAARLDVVQLRASLALLVAAPIEEKELTPDPPAALPDALAPLDDALAAAFAYRSELAATAAAVAASRRDVDVAFGQYYPSVSLDVSYFLYRETAPTERDLTGLLSGNLPLFAAGRIRADVRSAWSFFRQAILVEQTQRRQVSADVRQSYAAAEASDARLAEAQTQLDAARQSLQQAEAQYRAGLATNLDRVQAQSDLLQAQLLLTGERFDRQIFRLELLRASGLLREWLEGRPVADLLGGGDVLSPDLTRNTSRPTTFQ